VIRELDLGDCVLLWRDEGRWCEVHPELLRDERRGEVEEDEDDWCPIGSEVDSCSFTGGRTFVYGRAIDGVPSRVAVDGNEIAIQTLGGLWAATWTSRNSRVIVAFGDDEVV